MARENPRREEFGLGNNSSGSKREEQSRSEPKSTAADRNGKPDEVRRALRTVYDETLREDVPDEFKDLLKKLK